MLEIKINYSYLIKKTLGLLLKKRIEPLIYFSKCVDINIGESN